MGLFSKRKDTDSGSGEKPLYFALVVADKPLEDAKFETGSDCEMFITTGDMDRKDGIPRTVLKEIMERFLPSRQKPSAKMKITEESAVK